MSNDITTPIDQQGIGQALLNGIRLEACNVLIAYLSSQPAPRAALIAELTGLRENIRREMEEAEEAENRGVTDN